MRFLVGGFRRGRIESSPWTAPGGKPMLLCGTACHPFAWAPMMRSRMRVSRCTFAMTFFTLGAAGLPAQERQEIKGVVHWVDRGEATADTLDAAKDGAVAAARARLLKFRSVRSESELQQTWRERIGRGGGEYQEDVTARVKETAAGELRDSHVLESSAVLEGSKWKGVAKVACPERTLLPHRRLTDLMLRKDAASDDYLLLASEYAVAEPALEKQTLRMAWEKFATAKAALAIARSEARGGRDGEALTFADLAAGKAGDDKDVLAAVEDLRQEVRARVPSVEDLVREVLEIARTRSMAEGAVGAELVHDGGKAHIEWPIGGSDRVLKTWIDHEITLHWNRPYEDGSLDDGTARQMNFSWPPKEGGKHDAVLVLWRLPEQSDAWKAMATVANMAWRRTGEVAQAERMRLRELVQGLRATPGAVAVVDLAAR
jgi:hypothetical protein